jgi:hypothetical protein
LSTRPCLEDAAGNRVNCGSERFPSQKLNK